ncbi:MAG: DUF4328 domain-containing protein [bacterium]|nr:DUF4328 domain-containing protein [bacterium]
MVQPYRDPSNRAKWLIRLIAVDMALTGILLVDSLFIVARPRFEGVTDAPYFSFVGAAAVLGILIAITTIVVWLVWMFRCYDNVVALGERNSYSKPWVIFGWIIPFGSLWIPFRMTKDLAVDPDPSVHRRTEWPFLRWWWGMFIALEYVSRIAFRLWRTGAQTGEWPFLIEGILGIAAAPLAILVVAEVTRRQAARAEALEHVASVDSAIQMTPQPDPAGPPLAGIRFATSLTAGAMLMASGLGLSPFLETSAGQVESVEAVTLGDCTITEQAFLASVVDCDEPHLMQVVGIVDIPDPSLPDRSVTVEFASGRCRQLLERNTGISGFTDEHRLRILSPGAASWALGDRFAHCVISSRTDSLDLVGDLMAPSGRIPWAEMDIGGCYSFDFDFLSVQPTECAFADLVIEAIHIEPSDEFIATPFPGDGILAERAERLCSPESEWFYPDEAFWRQGDRSVVCSTPADS